MKETREPEQRAEQLLRCSTDNTPMTIGIRFLVEAVERGLLKDPIDRAIAEAGASGLPQDDVEGFDLDTSRFRLSHSELHQLAGDPRLRSLCGNTTERQCGEKVIAHIRKRFGGSPALRGTSAQFRHRSYATVRERARNGSRLERLELEEALTQMATIDPHFFEAEMVALLKDHDFADLHLALTALIPAQLTQALMQRLAQAVLALPPSDDRTTLHPLEEALTVAMQSMAAQRRSYHPGGSTEGKKPDPLAREFPHLLERSLGQIDGITPDLVRYAQAMYPLPVMPPEVFEPLLRWMGLPAPGGEQSALAQDIHQSLFWMDDKTAAMRGRLEQALDATAAQVRALSAFALLRQAHIPGLPDDAAHSLGGIFQAAVGGNAVAQQMTDLLIQAFRGQLTTETLLTSLIEVARKAVTLPAACTHFLDAMTQGEPSGAADIAAILLKSNPYGGSEYPMFLYHTPECIILARYREELALGAPGPTMAAVRDAAQHGAPASRLHAVSTLYQLVRNAPATSMHQERALLVTGFASLPADKAAAMVRVFDNDPVFQEAMRNNDLFIHKFATETIPAHLSRLVGEVRNWNALAKERYVDDVARYCPAGMQREIYTELLSQNDPMIAQKIMARLKEELPADWLRHRAFSAALAGVLAAHLATDPDDDQVKVIAGRMIGAPANPASDTTKTVAQEALQNGVMQQLPTVPANRVPVLMEILHAIDPKRSYAIADTVIAEEEDPDRRESALTWALAHHDPDTLLRQVVSPATDPRLLKSAVVYVANTESLRDIWLPRFLAPEMPDTVRAKAFYEFAGTPTHEMFDRAKTLLASPNAESPEMTAAALSYLMSVVYFARQVNTAQPDPRLDVFQPFATEYDAVIGLARKCCDTAWPDPVRAQALMALHAFPATTEVAEYIAMTFARSDSESLRAAALIVLDPLQHHALFQGVIPTASADTCNVATWPIDGYLSNHRGMPLPTHEARQFLQLLRAIYDRASELPDAAGVADTAHALMRQVTARHAMGLSTRPD